MSAGRYPCAQPRYLDKPSLEAISASVTNGNISPKSFHRNIEGTRSGSFIRLFMRSSSSAFSSDDNALTALPSSSPPSFLQKRVENASSSHSFNLSGSSCPAPERGSLRQAIGFSECLCFHNIRAYMRGIPMGYTCSPSMTTVEQQRRRNGRMWGILGHVRTCFQWQMDDVRYTKTRMFI